MSKPERTNKDFAHDPIIQKLIDQFGPLDWEYSTNIYQDLINSIISQQLSVKAANTIGKRFVDLFGHFPKPSEILSITDDKIRECGISYSKIKYIKGIAQAIEGKSLNLEELSTLPDDEVLEKLIALKGVGKWTAEMILIFSLKRPDVFSMGDLGLRTAVAKLYGVDRDDLKRIEKISQKWTPYRSSVSKYLWKSLDNTQK